jgi:hypothetical protein
VRDLPRKHSAAAVPDHLYYYEERYAAGQAKMLKNLCIEFEEEIYNATRQATGAGDIKTTNNDAITTGDDMNTVISRLPKHIAMVQVGAWDSYDTGLKTTLTNLETGGAPLIRLLRSLIYGQRPCGRLEQIIFITPMPYPLLCYAFLD